MSDKRSCASCAFCSQRDQGYSEYTVMGSTYECLLSLNDRFPLDDEVASASAQAEVLEFADQCGAFREGQRLWLSLCGTDENRQEAIDWSKQFPPVIP